MHQVELSAVPIAHLCRLKHCAESAAVVRKKCRLNNVQIAFGFDIVVVSDPPDAQRFIVSVHDTDRAFSEALDRRCTLKLDQAFPQRASKKQGVLTSISVWKNGWNSDPNPLFFFQNVDAQGGRDLFVQTFTRIAQDTCSEVSKLHTADLGAPYQAVESGAGIIQLYFFHLMTQLKQFLTHTFIRAGKLHHTIQLSGIHFITS